MADRIGSLLVVDCGTEVTKATLLDRVAGQYRLVAHGEASTTIEYPWSDITAGVRHAVEPISEVTGRDFFDGSGNLISPEVKGQGGVDAFAATVSASQPLQIVLGGLARDMSIASARRAAAGTYSQVKAVLDGGQRASMSDEQRARTIRDAAPDVVCIAGGIDGGATRPVLALVEAATLACSMMSVEKRPHLLYAGNARLRRRVVEIVGDVTDLHVVDNVRPTLEQENLLDAQEKLETLYVQRKMGQLSGIDVLSKWGSTSLTPTARAFGRLTQYLWHLGDPSRGVLGVDVGIANTTLVAAFDERLYTTVRGDLGVAFGGKRLLQKQGVASITRWLPEAMSEDEVRGEFLNRRVRPGSIPQIQQELWLEQALAREAIRATLKVALPAWNPAAAQPYPQLLPLCETILISGGVLARAPRPGQAALMVLDALEPIGVTTLVLDPHALAPALGSVAALKPLAAVEALDSGGFTNLATVVTPVGNAHYGDTILRVKVSYDDSSELDVEVNYGDLEVLPLSPEQEAVLELRPRHGFDVGLGGPGKAGKRRVSGGLVGLIIDARGRPLSLPRDPEKCHQRVQQWLWDVGGK